MATVIARLRVQDYDVWREEYERMHPVREAHGECGRVLYRDPDEPNLVTVVFEWDSVTNARGYFEGAVLAESVDRAGGVGAPEIFYLERA